MKTEGCDFFWGLNVTVMGRIQLQKNNDAQLTK
ncbi:hypothetical protein Godav_015012 [Gossypium davidsonii]|uniref:Uncharacterized protein n=2 Tax=Gossypium TaxID=3633 RepID=A0A7J8RN48_GOSDV|nr:hypothetical protein [Gossypium davidsonii]MBA0649979.1 hypothetical protein [Gossypium klotzschianum]